jgi:hypothetical protein
VSPFNILDWRRLFGIGGDSRTPRRPGEAAPERPGQRPPRSSDGPRGPWG